MESQALFDENQQQLEKDILSAYSAEEVQKHLEFFAKLTRRAGTEDELKAAQYIIDKLEEYGAHAELHELDGYISLPDSSELEVRFPVVKNIPCLTRTFIPSTPPEGIEAEVVAVGKGLEDDYREVDARGKIVLAEPGYRESRLEVSQMAEAKGAAGQIHITPGTSQAISFGQLRFTWGNPTPETIDKISKIPSVTISSEDGKFLKELCKGAAVRVNMKAKVWTGYRKIRVPVGTVSGIREPEKFVLFGGHYCSWFLGASDNAAANAMMLEASRIFSKFRARLGRSVKFAWWSGHEQGTYAGSTWFLDNFWDDFRENAVAYLTIDGIARIGSSGFETENTEEIRSFYEHVIKDILGLEIKSKKVSRVADHSFWGMGLPSFSGKTSFPDDQKTSSLWYIHTDQDTLDKVDLSLIKVPFQVYGVAMLRLSNCLVLPFEFVSIAEAIRKRIQDLQDGPGADLNLLPLIRLSEALGRKAAALRQMVQEDLRRFKKGKSAKLAEKFKEVNRCQMDLSRILIPILHTKAGRYGQDPMGARFKPIPALQALEGLGSTGTRDEKEKALYTALLRERNKISDDLNLANRILDQTLKNRNSVR